MLSLLTAAALASAAPDEAASAATPTTHCSDAETVLFDCPIGAKRVSLCQSTQSKERVVFYRFGRLGKVELSWPNEPGPFDQHFEIDHELIPSPPGGDVRPRLETLRVQFSIDGNLYSVFEELVDFDLDAQGIWVFPKTGEPVKLTCSAPSTQRLSDVQR